LQISVSSTTDDWNRCRCRCKVAMAREKDRGKLENGTSMEAEGTEKFKEK
jgi:hypothetical protein